MFGFKVTALVVHKRRGWLLQGRNCLATMRLHFGVKEWHANKVGQQMAQVLVGGISFADCVCQSKDGFNDVPMFIVMGDSRGFN